MLYCIEVKRAGIGEGDCILHHKFDKEPTREEILKVIEDEDIGYDDDYCDVDYYQVD
jgi:hypothetical protein